MNRRTMISTTAGASLSGLLGIVPLESLNAAEAATSEKTATEGKKPRKRRSRPVKEEVWPYVPLDPKACAQAVYDLYTPWGCMYCVVKGGVQEYAAAIEETNPEVYAACKAYPFLALRSGKTGLGGMESLCGAVNGAATFLGLFVEDYTDLVALIQKVAEYVKTTPLPVFVPAEDNNPNFVQSVAGSILCHDSKGAWLAKDESEEHKKLRTERCKRYSGSIAAFTVETLNEYFEKKKQEA